MTYEKQITYDRSTRDFRMSLNGQLVGYAPTYAEAEKRLDQMVYEALMHRDDVAELADALPTECETMREAAYAADDAAYDAFCDDPDDVPSASPEAPALTETFTPDQFPAVEATITPTSKIEWHDATVNGRCTASLMVDGKLHELAAWMVGAPDYRAYRQCEDVLEAALQVRDRLLRLEFEAQCADEPPVPTPQTRIEYNGDVDLFVAYVDGCEVTAAPTQAECNAALNALLSDDGQPLDEETAEAMAAIMSGDGLYSFGDTALGALHEGDIVRDALGDVHRIAHIGSGVLPVVTVRAGRWGLWRECDLVKIGA